MPPSTLGVMALYLNEKKQLEERAYFKSLIESGRRLDLDVFVFTPQDVEVKKRRILAHYYNPATKKWAKKWTAFPDAIFDRCRYQPNHRFQQLRSFRSKYPNLLYLNRPMSNKWAIYEVLAKNSAIRPFLPDTRQYNSRKDVLSLLAKHRLVYVKPANGTGGRGIIRIERLGEGRFRIEGRDRSRKIIPPQIVSENGMFAKLNASQLLHKAIAQQGLDIRLKNGRVHDYRMLIQKNGKGEWEVTGCAGRVGPVRSVTSNLHGGGKAVTMEKLLAVWFPKPEQIASIKNEAEQLAHDVVKHLEKQYGRLCEMALDLAIDRDGHIWLLEVNPKPGREIFRKTFEKETYGKAILRPLEYARYLIQSHDGS